MKRAVLALAAAGALALPAGAGADVQADPTDCVDAAKRAVAYIVNGTPQPQECNLSARTAAADPLATVEQCRKEVGYTLAALNWGEWQSPRCPK
jgi:hypothetical protein